MSGSALEQENARLRQENARLLTALDEIRARLAEPEDVIRAIRHGEVDALVVDEEVYALQTFDSVYRTVVEECFPYGVWLAEPDGRLCYVTLSFLELLNTDLQALREKGQFHFLPPEERAAIEREWARCRETGEAFSAEYTVGFGDGSERIIWTHAILARTHDGRSRWVGVNVDVTERERNKYELRQKAHALQEADRRKDEFLALLGHELRSPLGAIQNGLHILLMPDAGHAAVKQVKEMMEKQVRHLNRLVDDLLDVSRITRGKIHLRKENVALAAAVQHAVESVRPLVEAQNHRLTVSLPPEGLHLEADPVRLEQVLVNLLTNAIKYTKPGGTVSLTAERTAGEVVIRVRDTGVGIRPDMLPRVFDLFVQVDRTLDRAQGGLGIGLTLVKELVEIHGGRIEAHSEGPDRGSEFVVRLPALTAAVDESEVLRSAPSTNGGRLRVMVVDDSEDLALSLKMLLEYTGHEVWVAHSGPAALQVYRTYHPDVVLLDIGLPGMDGYQVTRHLRNEPGVKRALIVAMSGYGQEEDKRHALEAGCDFHMTKPVDPLKLRSLIASAPSLVKP